MEINTITNGLEVRTKSNHYSDRPSGPKLYVSLPDFTDQPTEVCTDTGCSSAWCAEARRNDKPERCEVDHKAWARWIRTELQLTRILLLPILADHFGVDQANIKMRFSRNAGCSCGCSPGFRLEGVGAWNTSTWVSPVRLTATNALMRANLAEFLRQVGTLVRV